MDPIIDEITRLLTLALKNAGVDELPDNLAVMVGQPPDPTLGDYALPCFSFAKALRKAPPAIAESLAEALVPEVAASPWLTGVETAGAYLNFRVDAARMAAHTLPAILGGAYFKANGEQAREKVMVEYSQPNTHKAFHVGHMRNVALGDALVRILEFNGHPVVAANYIGDVGTHIARCLWYHQNHRDELPPEHRDPPPIDHPEARGEWLGMMYTAATRKIEEAEEAVRIHYNREVSRTLQSLEAQEGEGHRLWEDTRQWSLDAFDAIYQWLGARFDHVFYESDMEAQGRKMVEEGLEAQVFVHSQGAVGADLDAGAEKGEKLGFFLVLKGDGTTLYSTKDLALARVKFDNFDIQQSIYVVGAEQTLHFRQVFKTLQRLGYDQASACHHLAYGLVVLPDGKMSSRVGNVILFSELRDQMNAYIENNYLGAHRGDWPDAEIEEAMQRIAVAAIRYGMVKQDPNRQIVFALEDWMVSEGDTGTYLCYAYTRVQSILRQVQEAKGLAPRADADFTVLTHDNERALIRQLHDFNRVVIRAGEALRPNLVANALFQVCKSFSRAYVTSSVMRAESEAHAEARLALYAATGRLLKEGLFLIGITPPERM